MKKHRVCVTACIKNEDKVLVALRSADDAFLPGHWEQVGGSLDWGEEPDAGLKREVQEETGLSIEVVKPYYVYHYIDDEEDSVIEISFICKVIGSNEVSLSPEHQEHKWITADEIDSIQPMTDMVKEAIKKGFQENYLL
jgi:8-oxo-dGTP diphosphatase